VTEYEVDVSKARQGFADMVNFAAYGGGRVLIARRNKVLCAIVSLQDLARLRELPPAPSPEDEMASFEEISRKAMEENIRRGRERQQAEADGAG